MNRIPQYLLAVALGASITTTATAYAQATDTTTVQRAERATPAPFWVSTPCEYEDSVNCVWDAGSAGNGGGHSFVVRKLPGRRGLTCVFYTQRRYAAKHDNCGRFEVRATPSPERHTIIVPLVRGRR